MPTLETTPLIRIENVELERGERRILSDVNLTVNKSDFIAITGPNGGGKTSLLRILLRLLKPTHGSVSYLNPDGSPGARLKIGYLPQKNSIDPQFPITVRQVIEQGLLGIKTENKEQRVDEMLQLVELEAHASKGIGQLSGGQLQRVLLARAIVSNPEILVLDEPLSYLDRHFAERTCSIIEQLAKTTTLVIVSHEINEIASMANRHIIIDGRVHQCQSHSHFVHYDCE